MSEVRTLSFPDSSPAFCDNRIRTHRYTLITWLPLSLLLQFRRVLIVYYFIVSLAALVPESPKKPETMLPVISIILLFTSIREGYEDY